MKNCFLEGKAIRRKGTAIISFIYLIKRAVHLGWVTTKKCISVILNLNVILNL
jgi:hypothetical protein